MIEKHSKALLWLIAFALLIVGGTKAQLSQSGGGGSSVTLQPGSNLAGKFGIDQTTPGTTNAVQVTGALPTGANAIGSITNSAFGITGAIPAGSNVIGTVNVIPKTSCGNTVASVALSAVPTSSTLATSAATSCVVAILMNNTNATSVTVTVTDNTGTPINDILTFSIPPNSQLIQPLYGIAFNLGVKWSASGTGVTGGLIAYQ